MLPTATDQTVDAPAQLSLRALLIFIMTRPWIPLMLGFALVLGVGIVTTRTVTATEQYNANVQEALVTIGASDSLVLSMMELNSAQRGYIIESDPAFRISYDAARRDFDRDFVALKAQYTTLNMPPGLIVEIDEAIEARKESFNRINVLIGSGNIEAAGKASVAGRVLTDNVRLAMGKLKEAAVGKLAESQRAASEAGDRAYLLNVAGLVMACLLIFGSIVLLVRRSAELERVNADVRELATTLEQRVEERTADLAEANEEIQRFAYIVSHDLRSPLVNIMGFTAELEEAQTTMADYARAEENAVPEEVRAAILSDMPEAMGFIRASTGRMDRLIKAILQISREGRRTLSKDSIDLKAMFNDLVDAIAVQAEAADARIEIGEFPEVVGDRLALEQVFGNLLDNAVKYLRRGVPGRISVWGEERGKRVVIRVQDNGRGIAEHDRRRVFELFRRSGDQDKPGEGIGLAHVQALVRRLGGEIHVESVLGEGSCFTVTLPLTMAAKK